MDHEDDHTSDTDPGIPTNEDSGYSTYDSTNLDGSSFDSSEVDMVMKNGQRIKFSFGFNFNFELLPGLPTAGSGLCGWKNVKASNSAFYAIKDSASNPEEAMSLYSELTDSMYEFQCYYDRYRGECGGSAPVQVQCHHTKWGNSEKPLLKSIEAIIDAQCADCSANGICSDWYSMLGRLSGMFSDEPYVPPVTPTSYVPTEAPTPDCDYGWNYNGYECERICPDGEEYGDEGCYTPCDEDQCAASPCPNNSYCTDLCEGYECTCEDGFHNHDGKCCYNDKCAEVECPAHSTCQNNGCTKYKCVCDEGYVKNAYGECEVECDENPCEGNPCGDNYNCKSKCKGYECECKAGYGGDNCEPDDKCDAYYNLDCKSCQKCNNGECVLKGGHYLDSDGNCKQKYNECLLGTNNCDDYANCVDKLDGYQCICQDGYLDVNGDGTECTHPYYTEDGECNLEEYSAFTDKKFEAVSFKSSYDHQTAIHYWNEITAQLSKLGEAARTIACSTDAGVIGCKWIDYTRDATACEWVHTLETVIDQVKAKCNDEWKVFYLDKLDKLRKATCDEPNDCEDGRANCHPNADCIPKAAVYGQKYSGFKCKCKEGFYGNGKNCMPEINECENNTHKCHEYATCIDIDAGYKCVCNDDYVGNGYKCSIPVNECLDPNLNECHAYADCYDTDNGYYCKCRGKEGYVGDGKHCTGPADECYEGTHTCHQLTTDCVNTYAGYTCKCKEGFFGDPVKGCWPPLVCPEGYFEDGYEGDFDNGLCSLKYARPCWSDLYTKIYAAGVKVCKKNDAASRFALFTKEMFNLGKSYEKKYGAALSHYAPTAERYGAECAVDAGAVPCELLNFENIVDAQDLYDRVERLFNHVFDKCDALYKAKWEQWLALYHNALICPVNECLYPDQYQCHEYAKCVDRSVGYECVCNTHYYGDGKENCDPIDYCSDASICPLYSTCNTLAAGYGYECVCDDGYIKKGTKCVQVDPCTINRGGCHEHASCHSSLVGYVYNHVCRCKAGYTGNGFVCDPIDPCEYHNCHDDANCVPYAQITGEQDYNCVCKDGYQGNGYVCDVYVDPCADTTCTGGKNTFAYTDAYGNDQCMCKCPDGYKDENGECVSTDPCYNVDCGDYKTCYNGVCKEVTENPCGKCAANSYCITNTYANTHTCKCAHGYEGDGFVCTIAEKCNMYCPTGTSCRLGKCTCPVGYWYDEGSRKCIDFNECKVNKKGESRHNCHPDATCENTTGGFKCTCNNGFFGDGVTCHGNGGGGSAYNNNGGASAYSNLREPVESAFSSYAGTNIDVYTNLGEGMCSLMGFQWGNLNKLMKKMQWTTNPALSQRYTEALLTEFQYLGQAVLARTQAKCDLTKAGAVRCNLLYFPHDNKRCQLVKRLGKIYEAVAENCNTAWETKYGDMVNYLIANNQAGVDGAPCEPTVYLP